MKRNVGEDDSKNRGHYYCSFRWVQLFYLDICQQYKKNSLQRDNLIKLYFHLKLQHWEIWPFFICSSISPAWNQVGVRQLKRILFRRGLTRRNNNSNVLDILHAIETEVKGIGGIIGYRTMHQRLVNHHNLVKNEFATF